MAEPAPGLTRLALRLAPHRAALVERIVWRTKAEVPDYAGVPEADLGRRTAEELDHVLALMLEGRLPAEAELLPTAELTALRAEQGVTPEAMVRSAQVWFQEFRRALVEHGRATGIDGMDLLDLVQASAELSEHLSGRQAEEVAALRRELHGDREQRAARFLSDVADGRLSGAELAAGAAGHGLDPALPHRGLRARGTDDATPRELRRRIERRLPTTRSALLAFAGADVIGLTASDVPEIEGVTCGIGPPAPLERAALTLEAAARALDAGWRAGRAGIHSPQTLGPLLAVASDDAVGAAVEQRFTEPLVALGDSGSALLDTVEAWLEHGMRYEETAAALHLHPNSLRKRLRRFEELTSASLRSADDLVAVWWALRRRGLR